MLQEDQVSGSWRAGQAKREGVLGDGDRLFHLKSGKTAWRKGTRAVPRRLEKILTSRRSEERSFWVCKYRQQQGVPDPELRMLGGTRGDRARKDKCAGEC